MSIWRRELLWPLAVVLLGATGAGACTSDDESGSGGGGSSSSSGGGSSGGSSGSSGASGSSGSSGSNDAGETVSEWEELLADSDAYDRALTASIDKDGNVIVAGRFRGAIPGETGTGDALVRKFDRAGKALWTKRFARKSAAGEPWNSKAYAKADADANIAVMWNQDQIDSTGKPSDYQTHLAKWDATGKELWKKSLTGTIDDVPVHVYGTCVAVDKNKNIIVAGYVVPLSVNHGKGFVRLYDAAGNVKWTVLEEDADPRFGHGLAVDGQGNVIVAWGGTTSSSVEVIQKLDGNGVSLWRKEMALSNFGGLAAASDGRIAVSFSKYGSTAARRVEEWDAAGNFVWGKDNSGNVTFAESGELIFVEQVQGAPLAPVVRRYDAAHNEVGSRATKTDTFFYDVVGDAAGNVVLAGATVTDLFNPDQLYVAKMKP